VPRIDVGNEDRRRVRACRRSYRKRRIQPPLQKWRKPRHRSPG